MGIEQIYSSEDVKKTIQKIKTIEHNSYGTYVLLVSPDMKEQVENSVKLPDNVLLQTSPFVEENRAYLIRTGNDIIKPRIGLDKREECPGYDEVFGCAYCPAEHCDYY